MAEKSKEPKRIDDVEKSKLDVVYCIPLEQRDAQMRENIARYSNRIQPGPITQEPIAIVGFGPSLNDTWEEIKKFRYVFSGSGSHKFLVDRGIIPTHHAEVDPRDHKIGLMGTPQPGTQYLIASCCHPKLLQHLQGFDIRLWHIHSGDTPQMLPTVFPRGEYILTGGSNVGLRAMVLARFLGFVNMHVFGMDCSMSTEGKSHAEFHPKGSKGYYLTNYEGTEYKVTQPLVEYARQFFHELKQMPEVNITLYGKGLLQHMAEKKLQKPTDMKKPKKEIAYITPVTISKEYAAMNKQLHEQNPNYGISGAKRASTILKLSESMETKSILDYGCGKGLLAKSLPFPIWEYDPAIPGKDSPPRPADLVVCTDVLEHVEPELLDNVLQDIARCTVKTAYLIVATFPAQKTLPDGSRELIYTMPDSTGLEEVESIGMGVMLISRKVFETLSNQINDETFNQLQQKLAYYKQQAEETYILADIEIKKQDAWTKQRRIKNDLNRFNMYELPNHSYRYGWRRNN